MNIFEQLNMTAPVLQKGSHKRPEEGMCVMELVSVLDKNSSYFTDLPACVNYYLIKLAQRLNDTLPDEDRQKMLDYIPRLLGTTVDEHKFRGEVFLPILQKHRTDYTMSSAFYPDLSEIEAEEIDADLVNPDRAFFNLSHMISSSLLSVATKVGIFEEVLDAFDAAFPERKPVELDIEAVKDLVEQQATQNA